MYKLTELLNSFISKTKRLLASLTLYQSPETFINYRIGKYTIVLPTDHKLPEYEKRFRQYDRFLPHLASYMGSKSIIIDVGANCADTVAAMADRNPELQFLCVEADNIFFEYLTENIKKINIISPGINIIAVNALAGKNINDVVMVGTNGTKSVTKPDTVSAKSSILSSKTLDAITISSGFSLDNVSLIKVDTDGYDYDVIISAEQVITQSHPLLFFECQFIDETQKSNFESLFFYLQSIGYIRWAVFDNFGALMMRASSITEIFQLMDYIWLQNCGKSARTVYYLDIFASTQATEAKMDNILNTYIDFPD